MRQNKVGSVMTTDVVRAEYGTPFKEVARLIAAQQYSGLPVVDEDGRCIGVISNKDKAKAPNGVSSITAPPPCLSLFLCQLIAA